MERLFPHGVRMRGWPWWARYGASATLVIVALELRLRISSALAGDPFVLFFPAVMVSSLVFDRASGFFATAQLGKTFTVAPGSGGSGTAAVLCFPVQA